MSDKLFIRIGIAAGIFSVLLVCAVVYDVVMREVHSHAVMQEMTSLQSTKSELLAQQKLFVKAFKDQGEILALQGNLIQEQGAALADVKKLLSTFKLESKAGQERITKEIKKKPVIVKEKMYIMPATSPKAVSPPSSGGGLHNLFH